MTRATSVAPTGNHATLRQLAIRDTLLAEYDHEMATTRKVLERVPEERLTWRPHERSMTLGGLAQHVANIPNWSTAILDDVTFELTSSPLHLAEPASHAAIMALFLASTAKARRALDKADGELSATWTLRRNGHEVFTMPRTAAFRTFVVNHIVHHRGQLSVYLRLNDVAVPAIYGPSADEG
ncbi:MAG: damage-inducible protein DinB [Acidobacteria bacterium]|nr:MAG: damage-inducible protein DinB [Acidobacteriota bacterium]